MKYNIYYLAINISSITIIQLIDFLPWWSFLIITFVLGFVFTYKQWNIESFKIGFIAGFLNWLCVSLIFHLYFDGILIKKIVSIFYLNETLFFIFTGIIGGIINGLASYSGYNILVKPDFLSLKSSSNDI